MEKQEYAPGIVSVVDENGTEHLFTELDRIHNEDGQFVALLPMTDENLKEGGEIIILQIMEDGSDILLQPVEDETLFKKIGVIFEERIAKLF